MKIAVLCFLCMAFSAGGMVCGFALGATLEEVLTGELLPLAGFFVVLWMKGRGGGGA